MKRLPWFLVLVAALAIAALAYAVWHYPSAGVVPAANDAEAWGQMGDYFGGMLNPVLSFFALIALLYTIHQQRQELMLTRSEFELARRAQERSADLLAKQTAMSVAPSIIGQLAKKIVHLQQTLAVSFPSGYDPEHATDVALNQGEAIASEAIKAQEKHLENAIVATDPREREKLGRLRELYSSIMWLRSLRSAYESNNDWVMHSLIVPMPEPLSEYMKQGRKS